MEKKVDFKHFRTIVEKSYEEKRNKNKKKEKSINRKVLLRLFRYSKEEKWLAMAATGTTLATIGL